MIKIYRTDAQHPDFIELVRHLDAELAERDGDDHAFYAQYNKIDMINHTVVVYTNNIPVSCGAFKHYIPGIVEIKRMYTVPEHRGQGFATRVLSELEQWAAQLKYKKCILETGQRQPEAIGLYENNGYTRIPNFGQYTHVENSLCFEKKIG